MLGRNRELGRAASASCVGAAVCALVAWRLYDLRAALLVLAAAAVAAGAFLAASFVRYRAVARLAAQVDDVLHGKRDVSFERMREGGLAVLASELDKMRSRLTLQAEELEREKNALADALADVSHQIKTPLTSLSLLTVNLRGRLASEGAHDSELARLREMERLEGRVEWLVQALLKLARIDAGVVSFARERVDVRELVARAAEPLAVAFDLADVTLEVRVAGRGAGAGARGGAAGAGEAAGGADAAHSLTGPDAAPSFIGDIAWTAEALENILKNCLEHTPAGGRVCVAASEDALACRIHVYDTGCGISAADLPHVFERFYRGEKPADAHSPAGAKGPAGSEVEPTGVGIGLALAQSLVTAQGGTLHAGNEPGAGACFDLVFFKAVV